MARSLVVTVSYPSSTIASYSAGTYLYPLNSVLSYRKLSPFYHNIVLSITQSLEPRSYNEASKDPVWVEAMNAKIKALELNDTWILIDMPQHKNVIGCKWVLMALGVVVRQHKAQYDT